MNLKHKNICIPLHIHTLVEILYFMYHQRQNKCTPKNVYLLILKLHSILAVANLLADNNLLLCYYVQVNSLLLK